MHEGLGCEIRMQKKSNGAKNAQRDRERVGGKKIRHLDNSDGGDDGEQERRKQRQRTSMDEVARERENGKHRKLPFKAGMLPD